MSKYTLFINSQYLFIKNYISLCFDVLEEWATAVIRTQICRVEEVVQRHEMKMNVQFPERLHAKAGLEWDRLEGGGLDGPEKELLKRSDFNFEWNA